MATLYEISTDVKALNDLYYEALDEETGEIKESSILEQFEQELKTALKKKSQGIVGFVRNGELMIDNIDAEIKRLQELKNKSQKRLDSFKKYVVLNMLAMNITKIETPLGTISLRKSNSVVINENMLDKTDKRYMNEKVTTTISKTAIKELLKSGEKIPGAVIVEKQNLQVK